MKVRRLGAPGAALLALAACDGGTAHGNAAHDTAADNATRRGEWLRAEGEREGKPLVWNLRAAYAVTPARAQLLDVSWHYATARADGQPDAAMHARFAALETQLATALGTHADLVATLDYDGQHDWYWYADSADAYHLARNAMPDDARRDIALSVEADAQGEFYATLAAKVQ